MKISKKNFSKKVYALYLAVAFFFTIFSFGNFVEASDTNLSAAIDNFSYPSTHGYPLSYGSAINACDPNAHAYCQGDLGVDFVATSTQSVEAFKMLLGRNGIFSGVSTFTLEVRSGSFNGTLIATSQTIATSSIPDVNLGDVPFASSTTFMFSSPFTMTSGVHYFLNILPNVPYDGTLTVFSVFGCDTGYNCSPFTGNVVGQVYYNDGSRHQVGQNHFYWESISPTPPVSSITMTLPNMDYLANPVDFAGTYTNVDTFDFIDFRTINSAVPMTVNTASISLPPLTVMNQAWATQRNLPFQGNWTVEARLRDSGTGSTTAWTTPINFGLGTTTISTSTRETFVGAPQPLDCSTLDIGCHIKNALVWLLYPSEESLEQFHNLTLETKWPFSYAYEVGNLREELFTSVQTGTTTISVDVPHFGRLTFLSKALLEAVPYSSTIKIILGWIIWFMLMEYIYLRVIKVHDNNTPV